MLDLIDQIIAYIWAPENSGPVAILVAIAIALISYLTGFASWLWNLVFRRAPPPAVAAGDHAIVAQDGA